MTGSWLLLCLSRKPFRINHNGHILYLLVRHVFCESSLWWFRIGVDLLANACFVNKISLEHSHTCLFSCCFWLLPCYVAELSSCNKSSRDYRARVFVCMCVCAQSCPTLCDPTDCSLADSSVHGILQARTGEWVTVSSSRGSSWPRDWTRILWVFCIGRQILYHWVIWDVLQGP